MQNSEPNVTFFLVFFSEMINSEQHEVIGWRDPSEIIEDTPKRNAKPKTTPCFSMTCANDEMRNQIIAQIIALKGKVCENLLKYDSTCTHFVCDKPKRSDKLMSCVAAGKWVSVRGSNTQIVPCFHFGGRLKI